MRLVQKARAEAIKVLETHGVSKAPVNVERVAKRYADVMYKALDEEVSGALVPLEAGRYAILVNDSQAVVRQRFTIAHELGHLILHAYTAPHADRVFRFRDAQSSQGIAAEEIQANQFASELLMPKTLLLEHLQATDALEFAPNDDSAFDRLILELASKFEVSKQAMTIRLSSLFS
jgi:Zn-dependent peptidase ImmA (M78 family)